MKEIVVTEPVECPFRRRGAFMAHYCGLTKDDYDNAALDIEFPPGCPLFENDYLIKRRCDGTTEDAEQKSE